MPAMTKKALTHHQDEVPNAYEEARRLQIAALQAKLREIGVDDASRDLADHLRAQKAAKLAAKAAGVLKRRQHRVPRGPPRRSGRLTGDRPVYNEDALARAVDAGDRRRPRGAGGALVARPSGGVRLADPEGVTAEASEEAVAALQAVLARRCDSRGRGSVYDQAGGRDGWGGWQRVQAAWAPARAYPVYLFLLLFFFSNPPRWPESRVTSAGKRSSAPSRTARGAPVGTSGRGAWASPSASSPMADAAGPQAAFAASASWSGTERTSRPSWRTSTGGAPTVQRRTGRAALGGCATRASACSAKASLPPAWPSTPRRRPAFPRWHTGCRRG